MKLIFFSFSKTEIILFPLDSGWAGEFSEADLLTTGALCVQHSRAPGLPGGEAQPGWTMVMPPPLTANSPSSLLAKKQLCLLECSASTSLTDAFNAQKTSSTNPKVRNAADFAWLPLQHLQPALIYLCGQKRNVVLWWKFKAAWETSVKLNT